MKEDWVIVLETAEQSKAFLLKSLLQTNRVECYILVSARPQKIYKVYVPSDKVEESMMLLRQRA